MPVNHKQDINQIIQPQEFDWAWGGSEVVVGKLYNPEYSNQVQSPLCVPGFRLASLWTDSGFIQVNISTGSCKWLWFHPSQFSLSSGSALMPRLETYN